MSTTLTPGARAATQPRDRWLRRHRAGLLVAAALVAATVATMLSSGGGQYSAALDPANADAGGARAIAEVLGHQGIDVTVVRNAKALAATRPDARTTIVVTSTSSLGVRTSRALRDGSGGALVILVDPAVGVPTLFGADEGVRTRASSSITAHCTNPSYDGLTLTVKASTAFPAAPDDCFTEDGSSVIARPQGQLILLGAGGLLANNQVMAADNAAVALRLLGQHGRLVWYVPDVADNTGHDGIGISSILPRWLKPGLWLLGICVLALIGVRGRRLGALVSEPLPVLVTAIETTRSRGRLYRKVNDRGHAAEALRRAAATRIASDLNLARSATADPETFLRDVAAVTGLDGNHLRTLLGPGGSPVRTDKDLTELANALAELTKEVRRS